MTDRPCPCTPDDLHKAAEVATRLYSLAAYRFNYLVESILIEAANGHTSVRKLVDLATQVARDCDYWDPVLEELYDKAIRNYPKPRHMRDPFLPGEGG